LLALPWVLAARAQEREPLIVRSARPEDLEMPLSGFAEYITPVDQFFVRTHVTVPKVDPAAWTLRIEGHVAGEVSLTLAELRALPSVELVAVLECAGNGRALYQPSLPGLQWVNGAVGNARWRGVRLRDLLQKAGLRAGAVEVSFDGADVPIGTMADFQRAIPIAKALHPDTILAYSMNSVDLPAKHGFPIRSIVPGWASDSWTKWLTTVRVLEKPLENFWMKNAYRQPRSGVAPGTVLPPEAMEPVTGLRVKSVIRTPAPGSRVVPGKPTLIAGVAWSGDGGAVTAVDVSTDSGRSWHPAKITSPSTSYGWRLWEMPWTPREEAYVTILARARDASGAIQPLVQEWNPSGYRWNVVARTEVAVSSAELAPAAGANRPPVPTAPPGFAQSCMVCHGDDVIRQQRLSAAQWDREINKMTGWGAKVGDDQRKTLIDYLLSIAGR
jgi:DMSO/TMAO reductase YedYZ molybdopterin-dependent catalytic subunit